MQGEDHNPISLRVELISENDLFFYYMHNLDEEVHSIACTFYATRPKCTHCTACMFRSLRVMLHLHCMWSHVESCPSFVCTAYV